MNFFWKQTINSFGQTTRAVWLFAFYRPNSAGFSLHNARAEGVNCERKRFGVFFESLCKRKNL